MKNSQKQQLTRVGVFYDGNYFYHVSNYYFYSHPRHARISISGLHEFIREKVCEMEFPTAPYDEIQRCRVVDSHYFRGRLSAKEASSRGNILYYDRLFDDVLMAQGVTTHYLPVKSFDGKKEEKSVDTWLSLEAYEMAMFKKFDVVVLIACDGDYVPLVRKLSSLGIRVMLLAWDFEYKDDAGFSRITRTSQDLISEVAYPLVMTYEIGEEEHSDNDIINALFVPPTPTSIINENINGAEAPDYVEEPNDDVYTGEILSLKKGYGFIRYEPNNLFFHWTYVIQGDFNTLSEGDEVKYRLARNNMGALIAVDVECVGVTQDDI
ncbi:MAG: NYN domain-containing protein [Flavobacteriales bacterium]|nr:NYN domain-containing protein [Flavobacteriales bacterium]